RKTFQSRRKQAKLDLNILTNALNNLAHDYIGVDYATSDIVVRKSEESEENFPSQKLHMDDNQLLVDTLKKHYPVGAILALEDSTRLNVYCGSINRIKNVRQQGIVEINIPKGCVLFFLGYRPHSGCTYTNSKYRIHFLCANPAISIDTDSTHIVEMPSDTDDNYILSPYAEVFSKSNGRKRMAPKSNARSAINDTRQDVILISFKI
ncbi:hypothetical protein ROZALSC1DRAFT_31675, partial [Rozella allomycis CSF55]